MEGFADDTVAGFVYLRIYKRCTLDGQLCGGVLCDPSCVKRNVFVVILTGGYVEALCIFGIEIPAGKRAVAIDREQGPPCTGTGEEGELGAFLWQGNLSSGSPN